MKNQYGIISISMAFVITMLGSALVSQHHTLKLADRHRVQVETQHEQQLDQAIKANPGFYPCKVSTDCYE